MQTSYKEAHLTWVFFLLKDKAEINLLDLGGLLTHGNFQEEISFHLLRIISKTQLCNTLLVMFREDPEYYPFKIT